MSWFLQATLLGIKYTNLGVPFQRLGGKPRRKLVTDKSPAGGVYKMAFFSYHSEAFSLGALCLIKHSALVCYLTLPRAPLEGLNLPVLTLTHIYKYRSLLSSLTLSVSLSQWTMLLTMSALFVLALIALQHYRGPETGSPLRRTLLSTHTNIPPQTHANLGKMESKEASPLKSTCLSVMSLTLASSRYTWSPSLSPPKLASYHRKLGKLLQRIQNDIASRGPVPSNWPVYPILYKFKRCDESVFYDFSLYDEVDQA